MGLTPNSSPNSYLSNSEFANYKDVRAIVQLASDTGIPGTINDAPVTAALQRASGDIESACLIGDRYAPTDLQNLTGVSLSYLKGLIADRALYYLYKRRDHPLPQDVSAAFEQSEKIIEQLKTGERIFSFQQVEDAGIPRDQFMTAQNWANLDLVTNKTRWAGLRQGRRRITP